MEDSQKIALRVDKVSKSFPGTLAVNEVDFDVRIGEVHALVGENGAGKSTLVKILSGSFDDYTGNMYIDEKPVRLSSPAAAIRQGIAMVYQELNMALPLSVAENVLAGHIPCKGVFYDRDAAMTEAHELLSRVGLDYLDPSEEVGDLSQHEMQLIEIAKALGRNPKIMILDEPTSSLTREEVVLLFSIIKKLKDSGLAIIYISHHLQEVFEIADRVTVLRDGCKVDTLPITSLTSEKVVEMMVGRKIADMYQDLNKDFGAEAIRVENLTRRGFFRDISFSVRKGEVVGFCGLAGAGRSEIARSICGLDPMDSGNIYINGKNTRIKSLGDAVKKGIGYLTEDRKSEGLALRLTVLDNMVSVIMPELIKWGIYFSKKGSERAKEQTERMDVVPSRLDIQVSNLSGGNQQKVLLGKWLSMKPQVLILDEPTRGVDVGAKKKIHDTITRLVRDGISILLISSDLPELVGLSNRLLVIKEGVLIYEMEKADMSEETALLAANGEWRKS